MGLLLPAMQQARESARSVQCKNSIRQLALGVQLFNNSMSVLPQSHIGTIDGASGPKTDVGIFVKLLPYVGNKPLDDKFAEDHNSVSIANAAAIIEVPPLLLCPSSPEPATIRGLSEGFYGPTIREDLESQSCNYAPNQSIRWESIEGWSYADGPLNIQFGNSRDGAKWSAVRDGLSNTILLWESGGPFLKDRYSDLLESYQDFANECINHKWKEHTVASWCGQPPCRSYLYSWAGSKMTYLTFYNTIGEIGNPTTDSSYSRFADVSNKYNEPFSYHPDSFHIAMCDGSVESVAKTSDAALMFDLATRDQQR